MRVWPRSIAPAGSPIGGGDLLRWARALRRGPRVIDELRKVLCLRFGVRHSFVLSTGRAGLTVILRALHALSPGSRTEVVLPSYTCYSVAASIVKAGLVPRIVDIDPNTLDFDQAKLERTDLGRVLAIVPTSLYGIPANLPMLQRVADDHGVYLVDDAAQAMGASLDGRYCGTFGDVGLLSFDKGKGISAIDGGVILTNSDVVASAVTAQLDASLPQPISASTEHVLKALVYSVFLRPSLYWVPNAIPGLGLGLTRYSTDFGIAPYSPLLGALALTMLPHLEEFVDARRSNAAHLLAELHGLKGIRPVAVIPQARPSYVRLPLLASDPAVRDRLLADLRQAGAGASGSYPASIMDIPELQTALAPGSDGAIGQAISRQIITLPTHPYVVPRDVRLMAGVVRRASPGGTEVRSAQPATN